MKSLLSFPKVSKTFDPDCYGVDVRDQIAAKSLHQGLFGIEIELEGTRLPQEHFGAWQFHADGSLRAPNGVDRGGAEYILTQPLNLAESKEAVAALFDRLRSSRALVQNSYRCSTHVHVNMRGMKLNQLASFVVLWACFEDILAEYCGPDRCGNLFALRLSDSHSAFDRWLTAFKTGVFEFDREQRYLALNPACLNTFGSLEIRTMRGIDNADELFPWLDALNRLREKAVAMKDPRTLAMDFSGLGPIGFLRSVFDGLPILDELLKQDCEKRIRKGFRLAQPLIYALSWDDVIPEIDKIYIHNPFGAPKPVRNRGARISLNTRAVQMPEDFN